MARLALVRQQTARITWTSSTLCTFEPDEATRLVGLYSSVALLRVNGVFPEPGDDDDHDNQQTEQGKRYLDDEVMPTQAVEDTGDPCRNEQRYDNRRPRVTLQSPP